MDRKKKSIIIGIIIVIILAIILPKKISDAIQNEETFKSYISNVYGVVGETFKVRRKGSNTNAIIRGVNGYFRRNWIRAYEIQTPFMDNGFEIWIDNREHYIYGDNFSEVISKDQKFQHLYSEWIKKQVGIEDENVELTLGFKNIDLKNIKKISEDYHEVFESIKNPGYIYIDVKNVSDINDENYETYFYDIKNKYTKFGIVRADNFIMTLYNYDTELYDNDSYYDESNINSSNDLSYSISYYNNTICYVNCTDDYKQQKIWGWRLENLKIDTAS